MHEGRDYVKMFVLQSRGERALPVGASRSAGNERQATNRRGHRKEGFSEGFHEGMKGARGAIVSEGNIASYGRRETLKIRKPRTNREPSCGHSSP